MRDGVIDAVSILGVDRATVGQAHEASVDLGRWIERELGLKLFVTNGSSSSEPLFRCDGESVQTDGVNATAFAGAAGWNGSGENYSSIFFSGETSEIDLRGLIPLAVYARRNPLGQPARPAATDVEATEGRKILTIGDFLDELLDRADRFERTGTLDEPPAVTQGVVLEVDTVRELANAKNGDSRSESPSVSSEPPENTA